MTRPPSRPDKPEPAQNDFTAWHAVAAAILQQGHGTVLGTIPARVWRHAYVKGLTPEAAASEAATGAYSARPAGDRLHRR